MSIGATGAEILGGGHTSLKHPMTLGVKERGDERNGWKSIAFWFQYGVDWYAFKTFVCLLTRSYKLIRGRDCFDFSKVFDMPSKLSFACFRKNEIMKGIK